MDTAKAQGFDAQKYRPFAPVAKPDRRWPDRVIDSAPEWCSVDLRDGNQALVEPMNAEQKLRLWEQLIAIGFKTIEVGFPSASSHDYDFLRKLIEEQRIPDDVTVQVLVQARAELISKTFQALKGVKRAVVHFYNSTSIVQRRDVFRLDRSGILDIAVQGATLVKAEADRHPETEWVFEYSPESFTGTELDFAVEICDAVNAVLEPTVERPVIINLPATVEMSTPNIYADQIEWFCDHVAHREALRISLHTHNDRGCAVAAAELGVMAGADRVEGTLMGNGERTGNMDIVTMAMNLYSQGIDPGLCFEHMDAIIATVRECTQLPVHPRHPYAGELVFTAFSGSHQDAINKCLAVREAEDPWDVAYLPIDPRDIGRTYQEVIRINSQSGKGGVAYVLHRDYGYELPRWLQIDFSTAVQRLAEESEAEVASDQIHQLFCDTYLQTTGSWTLDRYEVVKDGAGHQLSAVLSHPGGETVIQGRGAGVLDAFIDAMERITGKTMVLVEYSEHTLGKSSDAEAVCYVQVNLEGERPCGVGRSHDIVQATLNAVLSALQGHCQIAVDAA